MKRLAGILTVLLANAVLLHGQDGSLLRGRIISDCTSENVALGENLSPYAVDTGRNARVAYMQGDDGRGYMLEFCSSYDNALERYSAVTLNLDGAKVLHLQNPSRCVITGLMATNVVSVQKGSAADVNIKKKKIAELCDEDVYTLVALQDVEFVFKDGALSNVYESYTQPSAINMVSQKWKGNGRMDGWACLLCDRDGSGIYMNMGTKCLWRREPVPAGRGTVTGVIVHETMPRQGGDLGPYSIRVMQRGDIAVSSKAKDSFYAMAAAWQYLGGSADAGWTFPDKGEGMMWANNVAKTYLSGDYTSVSITEADPKGWVAGGSVCFEGPVSQWYRFKDEKLCGVNGVYIQFNLDKAKNGVAAVNVRACAGLQNAATAHHFPAHWRVSASSDGVHFVSLRDIATGRNVFKLCSLPVWDYKYKGKNIPTAYDMSPGFQEHSFALPSEFAGLRDVIVCISPADDILAAPQNDPAKPCDDGSLKVSAGMRDNVVIRFGEVSVRVR